MKYYKNNSGVLAYEIDGSQDDLITGDMVAMTTDEIDAHINPPVIPSTPQQQLSDSDTDMIRIIEDLTDVLIAKGVITAQDLPQSAQDKLAARKVLRAAL